MTQNRTVVVSQIDGHEAEDIVRNAASICLDARRVVFDGRHHVFAIVYGAGPTNDICMVCEAIEKLSMQDPAASISLANSANLVRQLVKALFNTTTSLESFLEGDDENPLWEHVTEANAALQLAYQGSKRDD